MLLKLLDTSRQVSDTGQLEKRTWLTPYVHDGRLIEMALNVTQDSSATANARLAAMRTVIWAKTPGRSLYMQEMLSKPFCGHPCYSTGEGHYYRSWISSPVTDSITWPVFGRGMPPRYVNRIDSILRVVEKREENPKQL